MATVSAWSSGLTSAATAELGLESNHAIATVRGAIGFSRWLNRSEERPSAESPSRSVTKTLNSIPELDRSPDWLRDAAATTSRPTHESDEAAVTRRMGEIAASDGPGNRADHRIQAIIELKVAQRAEEIARSDHAGTPFDNWVRATRELKIALRAEELARADPDRSDYDNWIRAEHAVKVAERAEEIARSDYAATDPENWELAERQLEAERRWIEHRAQAIAASAETAIDIRLRVEIALRAEEIKRSGRGGSDYDNWIAAERELKPYQELVSERAREVAVSPEAALANWLRAECDLRARRQADGARDWRIDDYPEPGVIPVPS